jgi:hypothetical protein
MYATYFFYNTKQRSKFQKSKGVMVKHSIHKRIVKNSFVPMIIGSTLLILFVWTLSYYWHEKPARAAQKIAKDIAMLAAIFERIEKECGIVDFKYQANPINFLTIKKDGFVGSDVGSMSLAHPEKWQGPYVQNNPTIQQKEYQVISTNKGYFIVPGQGVRLANGTTIGTDLILDKKADVPAMMQDANALMFEGKPLAAPLITEKTAINAGFVSALVETDGV